MELTTVEAKKRHSFNYFEYFEAQLYYQCVICSTVVEPEMGYCSECVKEIDPNNRQQLFCCECKQPIIHKSDYFINDKHFVSHYPVNYLACQCEKNLWIPFRKIQNPSRPILDATTGSLSVTLEHPYIWNICYAESSQYNNNEDIYFINCQLQEYDLFLKPYIRFNIGKTKLPISKLDEFTDRYYRICRDVTSLGIKLGILRELIRGDQHLRLMNNRVLKNSVQEILDFSGIYFANELLSSLLENCFARLRRLFNPQPGAKENTVENYRSHFLKASYPTEDSARKKYGIKKLAGPLKELINKNVLHDDFDFRDDIFLKDCQSLFRFYKDIVLQTIDTLNKMQQFDLTFNHEDSLSPLGLHNAGRNILHNYLRVSDHALTSYKHEQALELLRFDNYIDNGDLSPDDCKNYERKRDIYERNLHSFFDRWIIRNHQTPLNIIDPDGQCIKMPYGFKSMRITETHDGDYIIYIKTPGVTLCPNYRIECFGRDQNFARQVFREIDKQKDEHETVDLSNFTYDPSTL